MAETATMTSKEALSLGTSLTWDAEGSRFYEMGISRGVLFVQNADGTYNSGVAWNGLTSVSESPDGAEVTDLWADDMKYASFRSVETFGGTIEAYTYPDAFMVCDGTAAPRAGVYFGQQSRSRFALAYITKIGNDTMSEDDDAFKLHIVYGASASPSEKSYETINDSPDAITFSWEFETQPVTVAGYKAVSCITIDSRKVKDSDELTAVLQTLWGDGTEDSTAELMMPDAILSAFAA